MQSRLKIGIILVVVFLAVGSWLIINRRAGKNSSSPTVTSPAASQPEPAEQSAALKETFAALAQTDRDLDGLSDEEETRLSTRPDRADTDADGLLDSDEVRLYKTDPLKKDTDGDGMEDGAEVRRRRDPLKR